MGLLHGRDIYKMWMPVRGGVVCGDSRLNASLAEQDLGLAYALAPMVLEQLRTRRLKVVLERYAPTVPGYFLYYPSRRNQPAALAALIKIRRSRN